MLMIICMIGMCCMLGNTKNSNKKHVKTPKQKSYKKYVNKNDKMKSQCKNITNEVIVLEELEHTHDDDFNSQFIIKNDQN